MGHRHLGNTSQIVETDNDEGWNHSEQAYMHFARAGAPEGNNSVYPSGNSMINGGNIALQWNPPPSSRGYPSSDYTGDYPQYQPQALHPSHDSYLHTCASGGFHTAQENFAYPAPSSVHGGQTFHGIGGASSEFVDSVREPYKRKRPGFHTVCQRGSTSRYYDSENSSGLPMPVDSLQDKHVVETLQPPWDFPSSYRGHGITIRSEDTRNVRSRAAFDLDGNLARTYSETNPSHISITSLPSGHHSSRNVRGQTPNTREWNHGANHAACNIPLVSEPSEYGREYHFNVPNSDPSAVLEIGGHHDHHSLHRDNNPQNVQGNSSQPVRGIRSSYAHRSAPSFRASSSNWRPGHVATSDEGLQVHARSYSARHSRPYSTFMLHERSGRSRMGASRFRYHHGEVVSRDHLTPEGHMIVDRSAFYGSRSFDQYRDMRLDINNMTYEELLALEERIGTVSTGLSDDLISKCLRESIFCSSDQLQEGKCVICLEEYKNMDGVGTLKICGHDFHAECVRKWLGMKNMCPICKAAALDD